MENDKEKKEVVQREVLYKWTSAMRSFKKLDKKKFWTVAAAVLVFFIVLAILGQFGLMLAIGAVMFLVYVLGTVTPETVNHVITTLGVENMEAVYEWDKLGSYWFSDKDGQKVLNVDTKIAFPSRLILLVEEKDVHGIHKILKEKLVYKDLRGQKKFEQMAEGEWVNLLEEDISTSSVRESASK